MRSYLSEFRFHLLFQGRNQNEPTLGHSEEDLVKILLSQSKRTFARDMQPCKAEPIQAWIRSNDGAGVAYDALPGLSKIVNTTTLTPNEKAFFLAIAPEPLQDEYTLGRVAGMVKQGKPQRIQGFVQGTIASHQEDEKREQKIAYSPSSVSAPSPQSANEDELADRGRLVDMRNAPSERSQSVDDRWATVLTIEDYVHLHML